MLFSCFPGPIVGATVSPCKATLAVSFVLVELSLVAFAVNPLKHPVALHLVVYPVSIVGLVIRPHIAAPAMNLVLAECADIRASVCKVELSLAVLLPVLIEPFILSPVRPCFHAHPVLLVISPVAHISGPIRVEVGPMTMRLVVPPLSLVDISICML